MKVVCHLRTLRGNRTVRDLAAAAGISAGEISKIERGIQLPRDDQLAGLERAYGHPRTAFYSAVALLAIQEDDAA